jgi:hypothetical protein
MKSLLTGWWMPWSYRRKRFEKRHSGHDLHEQTMGESLGGILLQCITCQQESGGRRLACIHYEQQPHDEDFEG